MKKGFFLEDGPNFIGKLLFGDFGLEEKYVKDAKEDYYFLNEENIFQNFQKILNKRHKYEAGFVTGFAGSIKMDGAAKLASFAALRSGAGIVKIFLPKNMEKVASTFPVEVVKDFTSFDDFEKISKLINKSKAFFIGPGISREKNVENFVTKLLPLIEIPTVIDADALFFLANCENFKIPKFSILTPHRQEMKNLLKITDKISDEELINQAIAYSKEKGIVIVLKGVPTFVIFPNKKPLVVYKGDPGMATAGSGDVLTGIIASLVSQNYDLLNAAVLGVYLHALAGEKAAKDKSSSSMVASDIINELKII